MTRDKGPPSHRSARALSAFITFNTWTGVGFFYCIARSRLTPFSLSTPAFCPHQKKMLCRVGMEAPRQRVLGARTHARTHAHALPEGMGGAIPGSCCRNSVPQARPPRRQKEEKKGGERDNNNNNNNHRGAKTKTKKKTHALRSWCPLRWKDGWAGR